MYIVIVLIAAVATALWGWRCGLLRLLVRLVALLLAYALTWQETPALADYLVGQGWLPGLLVWPVAGLLLFVGGSVGFSWLGRSLIRLAPEAWQEGGRRTGALAGVVLGCALGLLMVWTTGALQDSLRLRMAQTPPPAVTEDSWLAHLNRWMRSLSGEAMATVAEQALGDSPVAAAATEWVRDPLSISEGLQYLAQKPELRLLFQDPASYAVLVRGSQVDIIRLPQFQALTADVRAMDFLSTVGLPGRDFAQQSQALAELLSRYAGNYEKLRSTPEFQALAQDADLKEKLQQGNLLVLVTHDKMRQLATMLAHGQVHAAAGSLAGNPAGPGDSGQSAGLLPEAAGQPEPAKLLYRWQDNNGRWHITENKPPEGVHADVIQP